MVWGVYHGAGRWGNGEAGGHFVKNFHGVGEAGGHFVKIFTGSLGLTKTKVPHPPDPLPPPPGTPAPEIQGLVGAHVSVCSLVRV
jgi:hypothetical protein